MKNTFKKIIIPIAVILAVAAACLLIIKPWQTKQPGLDTTTDPAAEPTAAPTQTVDDTGEDPAVTTEDPSPDVTPSPELTPSPTEDDEEGGEGSEGGVDITDEFIVDLTEGQDIGGF
ncbi:MAG: hypothetical protein J5772_04770 [Clostridia bacterium]|nr:hypothetical protein [Clostridia bacterium]